MLISDFRAVGNRLLSFRKSAGLTQAELAELAGLSDRTYADIERGSVNMRIETLLRICDVLHITPDELFVRAPSDSRADEEELIRRLQSCSEKNKATALSLLEVFLNSL